MFLELSPFGKPAVSVYDKNSEAPDQVVPEGLTSEVEDVTVRDVGGNEAIEDTLMDIVALSDRLITLLGEMKGGRF